MCHVFHFTHLHVSVPLDHLQDAFCYRIHYCLMRSTIVWFANHNFKIIPTCSWPDEWYYIDIYFEVLSKTRRNCHDRRSAGQDLNPGRPEFDAELLHRLWSWLRACVCACIIDIRDSINRHNFPASPSISQFLFTQIIQPVSCLIQR